MRRRKYAARYLREATAHSAEDATRPCEGAHSSITLVGRLEAAAIVFHGDTHLERQPELWGGRKLHAPDER